MEKTANINKSEGNVSKWKIIRIHPTWFSFIKYCEKIKYGEIEKLKIQDGLPMIAEEVKKKVKFSYTEEI
ncbi:MAG: hypothetical protein ACE5WD_10670 [Candidatus Aminicenantia bacterium]